MPETCGDAVGPALDGDVTPTRSWDRRAARRCSRTACAEKPAFTLSFQYNRAVVWIDDLLVEEDPHCYDLCAKHGARVTAPSGWHLEDRRGGWPGGGPPRTPAVAMPVPKPWEFDDGRRPLRVVLEPPACA